MKKRIPLIILLIAIDQIIKAVIVNIINKLSLNIIPNVLKLSYVENTGAAWGILNARICLILLDALIIFAIIKIATKAKNELDNITKLGMSFILAGGIGNLIDRIFRGYVIDYIDITQLLDYPVFNFADICIVVGVILVFVKIIINTLKKQENASEKI